MLVQLNELKPFVFEEESYETGLTKSSAVTLVKESTAADAKVVLRLQHEINHAPIQMENGPTFGKATIRTTWLDSASNNEARELARTLFYGAEPFELITTVHSQDKITNTLNIEKMNYTEEMKSFDIAPSTLTFTTDGNRTTGDGTLGSITVSDNTGDLVSMSPAEVDFDISYESTEAFDYNFRAVANKFTVNSPDMPSGVVLTDFGVNANSKVTNSNVDQTGSVSFQGIDLGDTMPSDQLPIQSGRISFEIRDMEKGASTAFQDKINQLSLKQQYSPDSLSADAEEIYWQAFKELLTPGVNLKFGIQASNAGGDANASYKITFVGDSSNSGYDNVHTMEDALNAFQMNMDAKIDKDALNMTPAAMFLQSGMLEMAMVDEGDHYKSTVEIDGTSLIVNGMPFPLRDMLADKLDAPIEEVLSPDHKKKPALAEPAFS